MKEYLEHLGISGDENLLARLLMSVWMALDWQTGLWKSAGTQVYERFESRVRRAARAQDLQGFVSHLARLCNVAVPLLGTVDLQDMHAANAGNVLQTAREHSGLAVATMRLWIEQRRAQRNPRPHSSQDQGGGL